jgi:hypothetical protein
MDLFADKYYELECENQINYYDIVYSTTTTSVSSGYTTTGTINIIHIDDTLNYALATGTGHIIASNNKYCHEVQITSNIKKIILE